MSTAAGSGKFQTGATYEVARPQGRCALCQQPIEPETRYMSALRELPAGMERLDCCPACWEKLDRADVLAFWQATMRRGEQKKRLFVDDSVLCELFERLAGAEEPAKLNFRFVLGLILMRKRLLIYDATRAEGETEIWSVRLRGREQALDLVNPRLGEEQVKDVSQQLGEILQQEM